MKSKFGQEKAPEPLNLEDGSRNVEPGKKVEPEKKEDEGTDFLDYMGERRKILAKASAAPPLVKKG